MPNPGTGFGGPTYYIYLSDGGKFTARLARAADQLMKLGVEPVKHFAGKVVRVTGRVEPDAGKPTFTMWVRDLADIELVEQKPSEKGRPMTKEQPAPENAKTEQKVLKVLTPEEAIKQRPKENVTVQFKVATVKDMSMMPTGGFGNNFILLKDGGSFSVRLVPPAMHTIMRLGIEPEKHFVGKVIRVTGVVQTVLQSDTGKGPYWIVVDDLNQSQFTVVKE